MWLKIPGKSFIIFNICSLVYPRSIPDRNIFSYPLNLFWKPTPIERSEIVFPCKLILPLSGENIPAIAYDLELSEELFPFGGGSAGGVSISPLAFIVVDKNDVFSEEYGTFYLSIQMLYYDDNRYHIFYYNYNTFA